MEAEDFPACECKAAWECLLRRGRGGDRKAHSSRPQARFPMLRKKSTSVVATEGFQRANGKPFGRLRRGETPACGKEQLRLERQAGWSRPFGATQHRCWKEQLGGASAEARSYWQGRFAACTFVGGFLGIGRPWNNWGAAPNPARELRPLTPQGALPLDPFFALQLERVCLIVRTCCFYPKSLPHTPRCPGHHHAQPSPSNPVSDPHTRGLSPPKSSHCPTISAGMSQS